MLQIQVSLGYGSLGMVFETVDASEQSAFIAQAAASMGYTPEVVASKLAAGGTLWLDRATDRKIRGYDAEAAERLASQREADRQQRLAADGYLSNY